MKILFACFSATGNTKKIADTMTARLTELGSQVERLDITLPEFREPGMDLSSFQAAVFGSPIHSMRAPRLVREWLATLDGAGIKCATFFTYGGFQVHPSHYDIRERLSRRGFTLVASAEFLGAHTFNLGGWRSMAGRPGDEDLRLAIRYADAVHMRFTGEDTVVVDELDPGPYSEEQLDQFEGMRYKAVSQLPTRSGAECSMCMLCQDECPAGAIEAETGEAKAGKCICCLHCLKICPDEILKINDMTGSFQFKMEMDKETPETLAKKKSKLYL